MVVLAKFGTVFLIVVVQWCKVQGTNSNVSISGNVTTTTISNRPNNSTTVTLRSSTTTSTKMTTTTSAAVIFGSTVKLDCLTTYVDSRRIASMDPLDVIQMTYPDFPTDSSLPAITAKDILEQCDDFSPNRTAPPNDNGPTMVSAVFTLDRLIEFSDVQENITVMGLMFLQWNITTCGPTATSKFNLRPVERLVIPSERDVWVPKYIFTTSSVDIFMKGNEFGYDLVGQIQSRKNSTTNPLLSFYHSRRGFFSSDCRLELQKFPFDVQTCSFTFALQRSFNLVQFGFTDVICPNTEFTEWSFNECTKMVDTQKISGNNVSIVTFQATLSRKPLYYVINCVLPNMCLSLLELASFLLPAHRPDRPVFSVTILLALTVAMSDVLSDVPKTSQRILLSDYILFLAWFAAGVTFYHMVACCLAHIDDGKKYRKRSAHKLFKGATFIRALDIVFFLAAVAAFGGIHGYAVMVIKS